MVADSAASGAAKISTLQQVFDAQNALTAKSTPTTTDRIQINDAAASGVAKYSTIGDIQSVLQALEATQETGTSTALFVTPAVQQHHRSACKAWITFNGTGTISENGTYNTSSVTDGGIGIYTVNVATDFIDTNYAAVCWARQTLSNVTQDAQISGAFPADTKTAGAFQARAWSGEADAAQDTSEYNFAFFGTI